MSLRPSGTSSGSKHSAAILGLKELPDDLRCSLEQVWLANRAATKLVMMRLHYHACRYFTPKEDGKFTALWFYVIPLDEHSTRVINHAVIVQPLPGIVKVRLLKVLLRSCLRMTSVIQGRWTLFHCGRLSASLEKASVILHSFRGLVAPVLLSS